MQDPFEKKEKEGNQPEQTGEDKPAREFSLNVRDDDTLFESIDISKEEKQPEKPVKKKKKRKKQRGLSILIHILIICGLSLILATYGLVAMNDFSGFLKSDEIIAVSIPEKADTKQVAEILKENGIISQSLTFRIYVRVFYPSISYYADIYNLNPKDGYDNIIDTIRNKAKVKEEVSVVIPEGYKLDQIVELLAEKGVGDKVRFYNALEDADFSQFEFMKDVPVNDIRQYRLEGYLFPDTYNFFKGDAEASSIKRLLSNYQTKITPEHYEKAQKLGMTMDQVITLASVIQKEAGLKEEMHNVSSVFHNRLAKDSPYPKLQSDVTCWYPFGTRDEVPKSAQSEFYDKNKYNTYIISGLPPGPICNPGIEAIEAALEPENTEYYFFLTDKNNKYYYAKTFPEHKKNIEAAERAGIKTGTDTAEK